MTEIEIEIHGSIIVDATELVDQSIREWLDGEISPSDLDVGVVC
jgi:hypothetical protein